MVRRAIRRRTPRLGLGVALLVVLTGLALVAERPRQYESVAVVVFVPSPSVQELELQVGGHIPPLSQSPLARDHPTVISDTMVRIYNGSVKHQQLASQGFSGRLSVTSVRSMNGLVPVRGPLLTIEVTAPSPGLATRGAQMIVDDVSEELTARQAGFDPRLSVLMVVATPPTAAVLISGSRIRAGTAFLALGVLAGLCVSGAQSMTRRRRRQRARPPMRGPVTAEGVPVPLRRPA